MINLPAYLPQDRRRVLARGGSWPDCTRGAALLADISGFTPLTAVLNSTLGPRLGAEELTRCLDAVYTALIAKVERYGGSVVDFAGDAITCWFDEQEDSGTPLQGPAAALRAVACAQALQQAMAPPDHHRLAPGPDHEHGVESRGG